MWIFRPVVWFATAYTIIIIVHETAHAVAAYVLGLHPTLFQFWVSYDYSRATVAERALVGVAGPIVSLLVGLVFWIVYRQVRDSQAGLPLCFLAASGIANFFGNLMSAAFVGDFSNAATELGLAQTARYAASFVGGVSAAIVLFAAGREIRRWTPSSLGRFSAGIGAIILPAIIGTALVVLINQPVSIPISFGAARAGESSFWLFGLAGIVVSRNPSASEETNLRLRWVDAVVGFVVVLLVRVMVRGIEI